MANNNVEVKSNIREVLCLGKDRCPLKRALALINDNPTDNLRVIQQLCIRAGLKSGNQFYGKNEFYPDLHIDRLVNAYVFTGECRANLDLPRTNYTNCGSLAVSTIKPDEAMNVNKYSALTTKERGAVMYLLTMWLLNNGPFTNPSKKLIEDWLRENPPGHNENPEIFND